MKVSTAGEMRSIDTRAIQGMGIPGLDLMERAGSAVARVTQEILGSEPGGRVVVLCGKGNNGGDGFVAARLLKEHGVRVEAVLLAPGDKLAGDAATNRQRAIDAGVPVREVLDSDALDAESETIFGADVVIDAILGSGISGDVRGLALEAIEAVNRDAECVVAVDAPSGLDCDTGRILGSCIGADITVTFGLPKRGHLLMPGREMVGGLAVIDIGFPREAIEEENIRVEILDEIMAEALLPDRASDAHKWTCGHTVLVAGSTGMTGAAVLAADSALRVGAGLTTLCCPKSINPILEAKLTETMTRPMPETGEGSFLEHAEAPILEMLQSASAVVVGPGISLSPETLSLMRSLIPKIEKPLVVDADGLNAYAGAKEFRHAPGIVPVLTPHLGELCRIANVDKEEITRDRIAAVRRYAKELDAVLLLKGFPTLIANPDGEVSINLTGSNALATAGSGDVLAGVIGGLLAQGLDPYNAARLGAYLHGAAGDLAEETYGFRSVVAGDVLGMLPEAILELEEMCLEVGDLRWVL
ncbi:MAG: NAD(P)H-hydrate dehydratase [Candidatus Eisenbacteria sp.]|nr:NAD(P)H-hydrate dehydratase [Candidatus Eisenbacteria bacterium]